MRKHLPVAGALLAAVLLTSCGQPGSGATASAAEGGTTSITVAEPVHSIGYLPLYAAVDEGYFEDAGLEVEVPTLAGGGFVNALLSKQAFGFIGGSEAAAVANIKGADLVTIANVVNRGNVYFTAKTGLAYDGEDLAGFLKGKTIAVGRYGGTPNAILRYVLLENGLDPEEDVTLIESEDSSAVISIVQQGQADIAVTAEPQLGQGIKQGIWQEPFLNPPQLIGPYAYSSIIIQRSTLEDDRETAQAFVDALEKGQDLIESDPDAALRIAQQEFPTMDEATIQATLDRAYADHLWEGTELSEAAIETDLEVARAGDILKDEDDPVTFDELVDTSLISTTAKS